MPNASDNVTRLAVPFSIALGPSAPANFSSFTLCLWFKVTTFRDLSCLLSYALSAERDDALNICKYRHDAYKTWLHFLRWYSGLAFGQANLGSRVRSLNICWPIFIIWYNAEWPKTT